MRWKRQIRGVRVWNGCLTLELRGGQFCIIPYANLLLANGNILKRSPFVATFPYRFATLKAAISHLCLLVLMPLKWRGQKKSSKASKHFKTPPFPSSCFYFSTFFYYLFFLTSLYFQISFFIFFTSTELTKKNLCTR